MNGILTFHDGINYGCFLQVYALQKTLNSLGYDSKILNYKSPRHWFMEYWCFLRPQRPAKIVENVRKIRRFKVAQRQLGLTDFSFSAEAFNSQNFETIVFGSDEIWNYQNQVVGYSPAYFGAGLTAKNLVAYAVSCGSVDAGEPISSEVKELLLRFNAIFVRDLNTQKFVHRAVGYRPELVLDPTLLYNFASEEVDIPEDNFIMVYSNKFDPTYVDEVRDYANSKGKKLISVGYKNSFCDRSIVDIGPFEFLGYVRRAEYVITNMFHGTLFSVKYGKQFCIMRDPVRSNKLTTILSMLGLNDRVVTNEKSVHDILSEPICYEKIHNILEGERERSVALLVGALASRS